MRAFYKLSAFVKTALSSACSVIPRAAVICVTVLLIGAFTLPAEAQTPVTTLTNPSPKQGDRFGYSVAIAGNLAVVGAYHDDPGGVWSAGTAYVFDATSGALVTTLNKPSPKQDDVFGYSVAVAGNLVVVGAFLDDPGRVVDDPGTNAGTAYVFEATTGALVATLNNPDPAADDQFGYSVAIAGNLAVVGAFLDDPGRVVGDPGTNAGTAYVFDATSGALVATLNNPDPAADDQFGYSVAIAGNLAVVGAYRDDPGGITNAGTAYVFDATSGALVATLYNPAPAATDFFGSSVAIAGTLAVVGAYRDDPGGITNAGTAFVFEATTGALVATLYNPAPAAADFFGSSVAIADNHVVVGAILDDPGHDLVDPGTNAGRAYVFDATSGALVTTLNNPSPKQDDVFGYSVAVAGNLVVVGAYNDDPGGITNAGTAYVFEAPSPGTTPEVTDVVEAPDPVIENGDPIADAPEVTFEFEEAIGSVGAQIESRDCKPTEVAVFRDRIHVKCTIIRNQAFTSEILYYAMSVEAAGPRLSSIIQLLVSAYERRRTLHIWFDMANSQSVPGCNSDCRRLTAVALR